MISKKPLVLNICLTVGIIVVAPVAADTLAPIGPHLSQASPSKGERIFMLCKACHTVEKGAAHKVGPNLWGVVDRPIASLKGFAYSPALKKLKENLWDYEQLNHFLNNPQKLAPQTRMGFAGLKSQQERADIIAYLRTLSDKPVPLPTVNQQAPLSTATTEHYAGLPAGIGREEVFYTCQACHSLKTVTQQKLSRDVWDETLDWMIDEQGMDEPDEATRTLILDYLAIHFGITK